MSYSAMVFVGQIEETEHCGRSAISKKAIKHEIQLNALGLAGDEQAETKVHGGADRALCHYPQEHYVMWQKMFPEISNLFKIAAFGENISTLGMTEENVFIGDIYEWGSAMIQVTQPRSPCYKLNGLTGVDNFAETMQQSGKIGWLYRVVSTGKVSQDASIQLLERVTDVSLAEAVSIAFHQPYNGQATRRLLSATGLSASWSANMLRRLKNQEVESFKRRLFFI